MTFEDYTDDEIQLLSEYLNKTHNHRGDRI
jgi:hypothetical protein